MNAATDKRAGERLGWVLGRAYLRAKQQQAAVRGWLIRAGCSQGVAGTMTVLLTILVVAAAAYVMSWLLIPVVVLYVIVAGVARPAPQTEWQFTEHTDHRRNTFYDPNAFTDDPDPRWDDR